MWPLAADPRLIPWTILWPILWAILAPSCDRSPADPGRSVSRDACRRGSVRRSPARRRIMAGRDTVAGLVSAGAVYPPAVSHFRACLVS
jgi:hypothetical protein